MNKKTLGVVAIFAVIGLIAGYWFFARFAGGHVSISTLLNIGGNVLQNAFHSISGIEEMRTKVLLSGAAGAALGWLISFKLKK